LVIHRLSGGRVSKQKSGLLLKVLGNATTKEEHGEKNVTFPKKRRRGNEKGGEGKRSGDLFRARPQAKKKR